MLAKKRTSAPAPRHVHHLTRRAGDNVAALEKLVRRMAYDDLLLWRHWSLEYLYLFEGLPHYRLYCGENAVGIADVRTDSQLPEVRRKLASYLDFLGWQASVTLLVENGALTELEATKRVRHLFK